MDNLTHSLIGLAAAKAGLEKLSPGTTTLCLLAANAPDADLAVLLFAGRWEYLHHHRGITHSIVGALTLAIALPLAFYFGDWLIGRLRGRATSVKLKGLLIASLIVTATHPIMDWTNNYGMRFLLPWNARWFYGDFAFVIDPFIWIVLGNSAFLLTAKTRKRVILWSVLGIIPTYLVLFGVSGSSMMGNGIPLRAIWILAIIVIVTLHLRGTAQRLDGRVAIAALATVTIYCAVLAMIHAAALGHAQLQAKEIAESNSEQILKIAAMPTLANPLTWLCNMETDRGVYKFNVAVPGGGVDRSKVVRYQKPAGATAAFVSRAAEDRRAEIFLGFARFPVTRVVGEDCASQTIVQFADLRYTEPGGASRGTFSLNVPVECPLTAR